MPSRSPSPRAHARDSTKPAGSGSSPSKPAPEEVAMAGAPLKFTPEKDIWDGHYEFGGLAGCMGLIVFSHFIMYYFFVCIMHFKVKPHTSKKSERPTHTSH